MTVHRTAMGEAIDMSAIVAKNEKVRAVGNMNVNARGDVLDSHNRVILDNAQRVKTAYNKSVNSGHMVPDDISPEERMFEDDQDFVKK